MKKIISLLITFALVLSMVGASFAEEYPNGMTGEEYEQYLINLAEEGETGEVTYYDTLVLKKILTNKKGEGIQLILFDPNRQLTLMFDFSLSVKGVKQLKAKGVCFDYAYAQDFLLIHEGEDLNEGIIYSDQDEINELD